MCTEFEASVVQEGRVQSQVL